MQSQRVQLSLGRTVRRTLKCAGTYSRASDTSSPRTLNAPPQIRTCFFSGRNRFGFARQLRRQRPADRTAARYRRGFGKWWSRPAGFSGFQVVQLQFELLDLPVQLFRTRSELHALQLVDEQFQIFDFVVVRRQLGMLRHHQRSQRIGVENVEIR